MPAEFYINVIVRGPEWPGIIETLNGRILTFLYEGFQDVGIYADYGQLADNQISSLTSQVASLNAAVTTRDAEIASLLEYIAELEGNPPPAGGGTYPTKSMSLYHLMWSNSNSPALTNIPANVNVLRLAFAQGNPPVLTGPASYANLAAFNTALTDFRNRGGQVLCSVGGAGGSVTISNRTAFVNGIMSIHSQVPLDGLDWDLEGPAMAQADVLAISETLATNISDFAITMAPNGANINTYLPIAVALEDEGLLTRMGQQFYDAPVTQSAMMSRINQAVAAGLDPAHYDIGMMLGSTANYWTVSQCVANYQAARAAYPTIGGAYLWASNLSGYDTWASQVGAVVLN